MSSSCSTFFQESEIQTKAAEETESKRAIMSVLLSRTQP